MAMRTSTQVWSRPWPTSLRVSSRSASSSTSSVQLKQSDAKEDTLNGPASTLPAKLNLPPRDADMSTFKRLTSMAKAYTKFYKDGMGNTIVNRRLAKQVQTKIHGFGLHEAASQKLLNRSQLLLLRRNAHDMKRLPLFGVIVAIFWEFTPVAVLAFPDVVPGTCRLEGQILKARKALEAKRSDSFKALGSLEAAGKELSDLQRPELLHISTSLGLHSQWWPNALQLPLTASLKAAVQRHLEFLEIDDRFLRESKQDLEALNIEELRLALIQRGQPVVNRQQSDLTRSLQAWLDNRRTTPAHSLLLQHA